jgi:hypothetical protein
MKYSTPIIILTLFIASIILTGCSEYGGEAIKGVRKLGDQTKERHSEESDNTPKNRDPTNTYLNLEQGSVLIGTSEVTEKVNIKGGLLVREATLPDWLTIDLGPGRSYGEGNIVATKSIIAKDGYFKNNLNVENSVYIEGSDSTVARSLTIEEGMAYFGGDITVGGIIHGGGLGDLAEAYNTKSKAGTIVAPGPGSSTDLVATTKPYQNNIIGVVSTSPSMTIGEKEGSVPIALIGRVPVKVTAENGIIKKGDLLTSSNTPGAAMKATKAGTVIGVALEDMSNKDSIIAAINIRWYGGSN